MGPISDADYNVYSWSLDLVVDPLEVTTFADGGDRTYIRGLKGWSGSVEAYVDGTNAILPEKVGAVAEINLGQARDGAGHVAKQYYGDARCTGIHPAVGVDGVVTQTIDFTGTGGMLYSEG